MTAPDRTGKTAILGAGSLGRLWAACLPPGQVCFIPRPGALSGAIHYRFRRLSGQESDCSIPQSPSPADADLLLVTTKAYSVTAALTPWMDSLPHNLPIILFQNGMGSQQAVADRWPRHAILAASTTEGAHRPAPDLTVHAGAGTTWVGPLTSTARDQVDKACRILSPSGLVVEPEPDIQCRLWRKLVVNAGINAFTAILDCPNGKLPEHPFFRQYIDGLCQEISTLGHRQGLEHADASELRRQIEGVARATANNTSSMREDMQNGRPTEIDFINGWLVGLGQQQAIATPVNQMLTRRVKERQAHHPHT